MGTPEVSRQFNGEQKPRSTFIPTVIEETPTGRIQTDPFSRLQKEQIIYLYEDVNNVTSALIVAQFMHILNNPKSKDIHFYIQSPGGSVYDGAAVIDMMEKMKDNGFIIHTHAVGLSMSMGSQFLVHGSRGYRSCEPNATIMLHEPAGGGNNGKIEDQINSTEEGAHLKTRTAMTYAANSNLSYERAMEIITGPDYFIRGEEAVAMGLVDQVDYPDHNPNYAAALKQMNMDHWELHKRKAEIEQPGLKKTMPDFGKSDYSSAPSPEIK
ncbi:MAG TPA: ATP-dependent Clp protease proteolytic subunit [Patescibacteria group bacterium]|jgi:ATP-dependent Clp protease protease subunit|nr:ATP-dependent Clp protease proteolytic subunit [Patescibacteria group bacterium]